MRTETNEDGEEVEVEVEVTDDEAEQKEDDEEEDREFLKYAVRTGAYQLCKRNGLGKGKQSSLCAGPWSANREVLVGLGLVPCSTKSSLPPYHPDYHTGQKPHVCSLTSYISCETSKILESAGQLVSGVVSCCHWVCTGGEIAKNDIIGILAAIRAKNTGLEAVIPRENWKSKKQ